MNNKSQGNMDAFVREYTEFDSKGKQNVDGVMTYRVVLPKRKEKARKLDAVMGVTPRNMQGVKKDKIDLKKSEEVGICKSGYATKHIGKKSEPHLRGRVACTLAHAGAMLDMLDRNEDEFAVVIEDDVGIPKGPIREQYAKYITEFKKLLGTEKPGVAFLGFCRENPAVEKSEEVAPGIVRMNRPFCQHAYMVNRPGARMLIDLSFPQIHNGDVAWALAIRDGKIDAYGVKDGLLFQDHSVDSLISDGPVGDFGLYEQMDVFDKKEKSSGSKTALPAGTTTKFLLYSLLALFVLAALGAMIIRYRNRR